jgi:quercetin dioxygenase-like cupin family protein
MSLVGLELDDGNVMLRFMETTTESAGARHVQEARYAPNSRPPPNHVHPRQEEIFTITSGALRFVIDGTERIVRAGDELVLPANTPHYAHNPHPEPAIVRWETRPALRTAELFRSLYGAMKGRAKPRLVDAAAILREYSDEMVLAKPPVPIQKIVFACLAPFGKIRR